jgi:hypothetical protein
MLNIVYIIKHYYIIVKDTYWIVNMIFGYWNLGI